MATYTTEKSAAWLKRLFGFAGAARPNALTSISEGVKKVVQPGTSSGKGALQQSIDELAAAAKSKVKVPPKNLNRALQETMDPAAWENMSAARIGKINNYNLAKGRVGLATTLRESPMWDAAASDTRRTLTQYARDGRADMLRAFRGMRQATKARQAPLRRQAELSKLQKAIEEVEGPVGSNNNPLFRMPNR